MRSIKRMAACILALLMLFSVISPRQVSAQQSVAPIAPIMPTTPGEMDDGGDVGDTGAKEQDVEVEDPDMEDGDAIPDPGAGLQEPDAISEEPEPEDSGPEDPWLELKESFAQLIADHPIYGVLYNDNAYTMRAEPSDSSSIVHTLYSGYQVALKAVEIVDMQAWYLVEFSIDEAIFSGYVKNGMVASADPRFEEWKAAHGIDGMTGRFGMIMAVNSTNLNAFPESYRPYIQSMMNAYPRWTFVPFNVRAAWNWEHVIREQMVHRRNLVPDASSPVSWKSTLPRDYNAATNTFHHVEPGWVQASEGIVRHYVDPRNFLNATSVFQFELLTFNASVHTESGVEAILNGTWMRNRRLEDGSGGGITYAQAFMQIGRSLNVSPYFLASRVRQEQGVSGTSELISGTYPGFQGLYNYFNTGAFGATRDIIVFNGLTEARNEGWTNRYLALSGGANKVTRNYIQQQQDTLYLQKFNVTENGRAFWGQYMQNLLAPENEGRRMREGYASAGALGNNYVFKVPVYQDMPATASPLPATQAPYTPPPSPVAPVPKPTDVNQLSLSKRAHVQDIGWLPNVSEGQVSGTSGRSLRVESFGLSLEGAPAGAGIEYSTHVQDIGWQSTVSNGALAGTSGRGLRVEAIRINLRGMPSGWNVYYRTHVQNVGWTGWSANGEVSGTTGRALRVEAFQVIVCQGGMTTGLQRWTDDNIRTANPSLSYISHVQDIGWQSRVTDGHLSGTSGRSLRVEAFDIALVNAPVAAAIDYSAHVQDLGWQANVSNGTIAGTSGLARRVEAIRISLRGMPGWNVYYRTHVQNIGWTGWSSNGAVSGTTGRGLRIEAMQVVICQGPLDLSKVR